MPGTHIFFRVGTASFPTGGDGTYFECKRRSNSLIEKSPFFAYEFLNHRALPVGWIGSSHSQLPYLSSGDGGR